MFNTKTKCNHDEENNRDLLSAGTAQNESADVSATREGKLLKKQYKFNVSVNQDTK